MFLSSPMTAVPASMHVRLSCCKRQSTCNRFEVGPQNKDELVTNARCQSRSATSSHLVSRRALYRACSRKRTGLQVIFIGHRGN
ncbi:hypothetical protein KC352_g56 [Hortaea werneckii]|nr:hypothetical protein KC352_g56 [Hortaea werneckii]